MCNKTYLKQLITLDKDQHMYANNRVWLYCITHTCMMFDMVTRNYKTISVIFLNLTQTQEGK